LFVEELQNSSQEKLKERNALRGGLVLVNVTRKTHKN